MSNLSQPTDLPLQNQLVGLLNSSMDPENMRVLDGLKACAHAVTLVATGLFTFLITVIVLGTSWFRKNPRYLLLCQHCACLSVFNILGLVLHSLRYFRCPITCLTYWILLGLQVVMARGITMTLAMMSICTCLSICKPLQYAMLIHRCFPWMMLLTWLVVLIIPVVFTVLTCILEPWDFVIGLNTEGSTALDSEACIISTLFLLFLIAVLIVGSYLLIYLEGCLAGHFSCSNRKGLSTIFIHILQISSDIVPTVIFVSRLHQTLAATVATFLVYIFGQSLGPVVYGLRCEELQEELPRFLPQFLRRCLIVEEITRLDNAGTEITGTSSRQATTSTRLSHPRVVTSIPMMPVNSILPGVVTEPGMEPQTECGQEDVAPSEEPSLEN